MSGVVLFKTLCIVVSVVINAPSGSGGGWSNAWGLIAVRLLPGRGLELELELLRKQRFS